MEQMLVWQKIAKGTLLDKQAVIQWLSQYDITACELETSIGYLHVKVDCDMQCDMCLKRYLDKATSTEGFNEVVDSQGYTQLRMW